MGINFPGFQNITHRDIISGNLISLTFDFVVQLTMAMRSKQMISRMGYNDGYMIVYSSCIL